MNTLKVMGMTQEEADAYRAGKADAHGNVPQRMLAGAGTNPCRCCLRNIEEGDTLLVLSYRPFTTVQAFAEQGPIFIHAEHCAAPAHDAGLPALFAQRPALLMRAYDYAERIVYGTGEMIAAADLPKRCEILFAQDNVAEVHVRSAGYNCFLFKVTA